MLTSVAGCHGLCRWNSVCLESTSTPNGTASQSFWEEQEAQADASKLVIYDHEFQLRSDRLNPAGQDHVKQIAAVLHAGSSYPVVVERTMNATTEGEYKYPVNPDPVLDNQRRDVIVAALSHMGIQNAEELVVVAPAFAEGLSSTETEIYGSGNQNGQVSGAFGGGFGGFGGFGGSGLGGFGGGGFSNVSPSSTDTPLAAGSY